ncbi:MAG: tetratricopeptide repeat protein [Planctomycetota bacterium]|jgi:tetratricopeptide (TPR) repeat protein
MWRSPCLALALLGACAATLPEPRAPRPAPAGEWVRTGDRLRRQGRHEAAGDAYGEALRVDGNDVRAHVGRQLLALREGRDLQLRRRYREGGDPFLSARLEPESPERRAAYGRAAEPWSSFGLATSEAGRRGSSARARHLFARALALDPAHTWSRLGHARLLLEEGRLAEAEVHYRAALFTEPEHPVPWLGLSILADRRGDHHDALRWAQEAFRRAPAETFLAERLYRIALRAGTKGARERAARLLEELGDHGEGLSQLYAGDLWRRIGEPEGARRARGRARRLGATAAEVEATEPRPLSPAMGRFVRAFARGVEARYRHYSATGEAESFPAFVAWARGLFERTTGRTLGPAATPLDFAFVGTLIDPTLESDEPLVQACAQEGLVLVLGRRRGGPPEALLAEVVAREPMRRIRIRSTEVEREEVLIGRRYVSGHQEWQGGGDLAGVALARIVLVDLHAVARWEGDLRRRRRVLEPFKQELLAEPALADDEVTSVDDPAGVADRLYLTGPFDLTEEVRIHENAHLADAARHLPVTRHPLRNLGLALRRGFRASEILAFLERNAQLTAIAEGPAPRAALAGCCAVLGQQGVHAKGYGEIVQALVDEIHERPERYPEIDPERVIVQQLHRLPEAKVRAAAQRLMERWGLHE